MTASSAALALIPARGGSKGIPGKNLQGVGGVSLVGRSVAAALASQRVGRVVVSTDDDAIAAEALKHGAEVVRRPAAIAGDTASSESALLHALDCLEEQGPLPAQLVFLQCTSPFTQGQQIDRVLAALDAAEVNSSFAVAPWHGFLWREDGRWGHQPRPPAAASTPGSGAGLPGDRSDLCHEHRRLPPMRHASAPLAAGGGRGRRPGNRYPRRSGLCRQLALRGRASFAGSHDLLEWRLSPTSASAVAVACRRLLRFLRRWR